MALKIWPYPDDPGMHNSPGMRGQPSEPNLNSYFRPAPSIWERVKRSLMAILIGLGLLVFATCLLFWNEGRAVQTAKSLDEGLHAVHTIPSSGVMQNKYNGELVHLIGYLQTAEVVFDEAYGVAVHAVRLKRKVEMYQWVEQERKREIQNDDGTKYEEVSYSYDKEWKSELVRSTSFYNRVGHHNPDSIPVKSRDLTAHVVNVGHFQLSKSLIDKINNFKRLTLRNDPKNELARLANNAFYHGHDHNDPQIGDVRVTYEYAGLSGKAKSDLGPPEKVSILAKQMGSHLAPYQTSAGDTLEFLYFGEHSAVHIIGQEQLHNTFITWALRFIGWLLMFVGFGCMTSILVALVDWVPLIRDLVSLSLATLNACLSVCLSLTVIAAGWIRYRPWLGVTLFVIAVAPFVISRVRLYVNTRRRPRTTRNWYD